jgi:formamidopyrimidine-DNA glycosylase
MPEGPEIIILAQYLTLKLINKNIKKATILSGKYTKKKPDNFDLLTEKKIKNINSKGKILWMELEDINTNLNIYFITQLGLTGFWGFTKQNSDRIQLDICDKKDNYLMTLCYNDSTNFGNLYICNKISLDNKLNTIAYDILQGNITNKMFIQIVKNFIKKSKKRSDKLIANILMEQTLDKGLVSGIGNYLMAEILYDAKINPYKTIGSLTKNDLIKLLYSIKYISKLSYYNNETGYMTHFGNFIKEHKQQIDNGKYPNFNKDINLENNASFKFKVYGQSIDPYGNIVKADKNIQKNRTTYWVPNIQKIE